MKYLLAPMATLSHEALRHTIEKFGGCDEYYTEMINAASLIHGGSFEKFYLMNGPAPEKIVWQLTGEDSDKLKQAAEITAEKGGIGIDINMGCAAPDIYKHGAGIAWMLKPRDETAALLDKIKDVCLKHSMRLSVKFRLGAEDFTEESFLSFTDMLAAHGVQQMVLHPRTLKEKYTRPPRWQYIDMMCKHVKASHPEISVIGNGGIKDCASFKAICKAAPQMDGVMLARYAIQKPWIFAELKKCGQESSEKQCADLFAIAESFTADLEIYQPQEFYDTRSRRFFAYFLDNFMYGHYLKSQILNTAVRKEQLAFLEEYLKKMPSEQFAYF